MTLPRILVFTYGNPSRGDDAVGPALYERLLEHFATSSGFEHVQVQTDFQLQIEHATDLQEVDEVIFMDASIACGAPFEQSVITACKDDSFTTHALHPSSVLAVYEEIYHQVPPSSSLMTVRGYEFELGQSLSKQASSNMDESFGFLIKYLLRPVNRVIEQACKEEVN